MIPYCIAHGIGIIPWGPLHSGDLARPIGQGSTRQEASKIRVWLRPQSAEDKAIVERADELAHTKDWENAQVALARIKASPIVGVSAICLVKFHNVLPDHSEMVA